MAPHRNHVEARSSRAPARQFVSESHDHKPTVGETPTRGQIYLGLEHSKDHIVAVRARVIDDAPKLEAACVRLTNAFASKHMVEVKLAAEEVEKWASEIESANRQIKYLASGLVKAATEHVNRKVR